MSIIKYFRPNFNQHGPEILGVKDAYCNLLRPFPQYSPIQGKSVAIKQRIFRMDIEFGVSLTTLEWVLYLSLPFLSMFTYLGYKCYFDQRLVQDGY
jgi:hypothetical protein